MALINFLSGCKEDEIDIPILLLEEVRIAGGEVIVSGQFENLPREQIETFGLIWSESSTFELANSLREAYPKDQFTESFSLMISTIEPSTEYYCRSFVQTSSNTFYSNIQFFTSPSKSKLESSQFTPEITTIFPSTLHFLDTFRIDGKNFGIDPEANRILVNEDTARILSRSDTTVTAVFPVLNGYNEFFKSGELAIRVLKYAISSGDFKEVQLKAPEITSISHPEAIYAANTLNVSGRGLHPTETRFAIDSENMNYRYYNGVFYVDAPPTFETLTGSFKITVGPNSKELNNYKILAPEILNDLTNVELGPLQMYTIHGKNLNNPALHFYINDQKTFAAKTDTSMSFRVPRTCEKTLDLKFKYASGVAQSEKVIASPPRAKIQVLDYSVTENSLYDAVINAQIQYLNIHDWSATIQGLSAPSRIISQNDDVVDIEIKLPANVTPSDIPLDLQINGCDDSIEIESILTIPRPVINSPSSRSSFSYLTITGDYLDGNNKKVYIDDETIIDISADLTFKIPYLEDGSHALKFEVNGGISDPVSIEIQNIWEKVSTLDGLVPEITSDNKAYPITFLNNDKLLVGSPVTNDRSFYEIDLNTGAKRKLRDLPVESGISDSSPTEGFVYYRSYLYSYSFQEDTWQSYPDLPDTLFYANGSNFDQMNINVYNGFYADNKFFLFFSNAGRPYCYFDFSQNMWIKMTNGPFQEYSGSPFTYSDGLQFYLTYFGYIYEYDPFSQNFISHDFAGLNIQFIGANSRQGFHHNNELYLYADDHFEIMDITDYSLWKIFGPDGGDLSHIIKDGNYVYLIAGLDIWRFDLNNR